MIVPFKTNLASDKRLMFKRFYMIGMLLLSPALAQAQTPDARINDNAAQEAVRNAPTSQPKTAPKPKLNVDEAAKSLEGDQGQMGDSMPSLENLQQLQRRMQAQPNNLDYAFAYAQMAGALNEHVKAASAYEAMLRAMPDLDRVRLDLGATYLRLGKLEQAKTELETVLKRQPPESVRANVEAILAGLNKELSAHEWSGSVAIGINSDSNGNSAASSDQILIFDTPINLGADQRAEDDLQLFTAASVRHVYKPMFARGQEISAVWNTDVSAYKAEQSELENLDLSVLSLNVGPDIIWKKSGFKLSPSLGYQHITLATQTYLRNTAAQLEAEYPLSKTFLLTAGTKHEIRDFDNSSEVSTYQDRNGTASQVSIGARWAVTPADYLNAEFTQRVERARKSYFDNDQSGITAGYTHLFSQATFGVASVGYKDSRYDDNDGLISRKARRDKERSAGFTLGYRLNDTLTLSGGYQYRDINSNLLNYDYDNHRFTTSLSARF